MLISNQRQVWKERKPSITMGILSQYVKNTMKKNTISTTLPDFLIFFVYYYFSLYIIFISYIYYISKMK